MNGAREIFVSNALEGIEETYECFLKSGFEESNKKRFFIVASALRRVPEEEREEQFQRICSSYRTSVEEEIGYDGPDVVNMFGVINAIKKSKAVIFELAKNVDKKLEVAKAALVERYSRFGGWSTEALYEKFITNGLPEF